VYFVVSVVQTLIVNHRVHEERKWTNSHLADGHGCAILILSVNFPRKVSSIAVLVLLLSACGHRHQRVLEVDYVSAPQVTLRDQLSQVYNKVGNAKNGDRVEVLDRERRFARVRTPSGIEGWVEQRYLVSQQVYDGFQKLTQ